MGQQHNGGTGASSRPGLHQNEKQKTTTEDMKKSDKVLLIAIRFLSIAGFASSVFACFTSHYTVTINEHPYVEHLFTVRCEDLMDDTLRQYCESSLVTRYYTLWRGFGSFFSLQDWDGGVLCGNRETTLFNENDNNHNGDLVALIEGNLGQCSESVGNVMGAFTVLACIFASFLAIYMTVLLPFIQSGNHPLASRVFRHSGMVILMLSTMICSAVAIAIYCLKINPLRLEPSLCEQQTLFDHCEEGMGVGFWFQVTTLITMTVALVLDLAWWKTSSPALLQQELTKMQEVASMNAFYKRFSNWHFIVHLIRFSELAILIIGVVSTFTRVRTTIPAAATTTSQSTNSTTTSGVLLFEDHFGGPKLKGVETDTEINLWQGLFCHDFGARLFLWSVVLDGDLHEDVSKTQTFGQCEERDLFDVQLGYTMATVSAITAMTFQKDAKTMPLAYMFGFIMHFLSMVKLSWAIGAFMRSVYPGRKGIDPSYCSIWNDYYGSGPTSEEEEASSCSIEIGVGLILTAAALGTVVISFIGELAVQRHSEYGVGSAWRTLTGRLRQGRFTDLANATSERDLNVDDDDDEVSDQGMNEFPECAPGASKDDYDDMPLYMRPPKDVAGVESIRETVHV